MRRLDSHPTHRPQVPSTSTRRGSRLHVAADRRNAPSPERLEMTHLIRTLSFGLYAVNIPDD